MSGNMDGNKTKKVFAICGSTLTNSSNLRVLKTLASLSVKAFRFEIFTDISTLPHFNPENDHADPPATVAAFRNSIADADGVIICSPEYVFSLPGSLKNALEWCVSTTVFFQKPVGLITAAASGEKAHEQLKLIMKTIEATFNEANTLLIKGVKGKIDNDGAVHDSRILQDLNYFLQALEQLINDQVAEK